MQSRLIISIDPGELLNGVAIFEVTEGPTGTIKLLWCNRITTQKLGELIEKAVPKDPIICYEKYRVFNHKLNAHRYSRVQTIESIGMIEYLVGKFRLTCYSAMSVNHKVKTSPVSTKWLKLSGMWDVNIPSNHVDHVRDAIRIGVYQWRDKGILNAGKRVITNADRTILNLPLKSA